jgi:hypothetical protein
MLAYTQGDAIDMRETLKAFPLNLLSVENFVRSVTTQSAPP